MCFSRIFVFLFVVGINGLKAGQAGMVDPFSLPDSIEQVLGTMSVPQKLTYLLQEIKAQQHTNQDLALAMANEAYIMAKSNYRNLEEHKARLWVAWLTFQNKPGPYDLTLSEARICADEFQKMKQPFWAAWAYGLNAAISWDMSRDSVSARLMLNKGLATIAQIKNQTKDSLWVFGYLNSIRGNLESSLEMHQLSLEQYQLSGDQDRIAKSNIKIANVFLRASQFDSAQYYALKALDAYSLAGRQSGVIESYGKLVDVLLYKYQNTKSENEFTATLNICKELNKAFPAQPEGLARLGVVYLQKATMLEKRQPTISALCFDTAYQFFQRALPIADKTQNWKTVKLILDNLVGNCEKFQKCDTITKIAFDIYTKQLKLKDDATAHAQQEMDKYYTEQRFAAITAEKQKQQLILIISFITICGIGFAFYWINNRRKVKSLNKALEHRMEALRAQMNPHFISNTLNAIDSLVNHGRNKEASYYIIQFSRLCRIILNNSRSEKITLGEELEMLQYFLNLEKLRLGEKLSFQIDIDPSLNKDAIMLPPMIIQPFAENAIWHGIQPDSKPGSLTIKVLRYNEQSFQCTIMDTGIGREKSRELKKRMVITQPSHGLSITEERIETLYKTKGSAIFTEDIIGDNSEVAGTRVTITLPI